MHYVMKQPVACGLAYTKNEIDMCVVNNAT